MSSDRWRVAGLATPGSAWFRDLARWSTAAAIEVDFVKCVSVNEIQSRLAANERYSALLIGAGVSGLNRALVAAISNHGTVVIVVGDESHHQAHKQIVEIGAVAILPERFRRDDLISVLAEHAVVVSAINNANQLEESNLAVGWQGRLIAVTGSPGSGASLLAMALARGLASEASNHGMVLLADLALNSDQAVIHDTREVMPGLQELVEACHDGWIGRERLHSMVFEPAGRGYHLLLGLRKHRDWITVHRLPLETALAGLARTYRFVVTDIEADTEGQSDTGYAGIEDRNRLARTATARSDLVVVVGTGTTLGLYSLRRTILGLVERGVEVGRLLPVINRISRHRQQRKSIAKALSEVLRDTAAANGADPVFVAERRDVESALRDGVMPAAALGRELTATVATRLSTL